MKTNKIVITLDQNEIPEETKGYGLACTRLKEAGAKGEGEVVFYNDPITFKLIATWEEAT